MDKNEKTEEQIQSGALNMTGPALSSPRCFQGLDDDGDDYRMGLKDQAFIRSEYANLRSMGYNYGRG